MLSQHHSPDPAWTAHLQQLLVDQGYDPGPVDGIFGSLTDAPCVNTSSTMACRRTASSGHAPGRAQRRGRRQHRRWNRRRRRDITTARVVPDPAVRLFRIELGITNEGEWEWGANDVAYDLTVTREEVLVQQTNDAVGSLAPGASNSWTVAFLGTNVEGRYVALYSVIDRTTNSTIAFDQSSYTR